MSTFSFPIFEEFIFFCALFQFFFYTLVFTKRKKALNTLYLLHFFLTFMFTMIFRHNEN